MEDVQEQCCVFCAMVMGNITHLVAARWRSPQSSTLLLFASPDSIPEVVIKNAAKMLRCIIIADYLLSS